MTAADDQFNRVPGEDVPEVDQAELQRAAQAARSGNAAAMLEALYASHFLDGLTRQLEDKWRYLTQEDVENAISEALDELLKTMRDGRPVRSPAGFVYRVAGFKASDCNSRKDRERNVPTERLDHLPSPKPTIAETIGEDEPAEAAVDALDPESKRALAIRLARQLIARIEVDAERNVMSVIIDAIERGVAHELEASDIGKIVGINPAYVRKAKERGFKKLERLAREAGLWKHDLDLTALGVEVSVGAEDEDAERAERDD